MHTINPLSSLRALKGAPLSCLVALMFSNQPVGKEWLSRMTGYSDKPVSKALAYLLEMGFVSSNGRYEAWQICAGAVQLPLAAEGFLPETSRNYSDSRPTATTTAMEERINQPVKAVVEEPSSRNFSDSHKILRSAGVGEPMVTKLSKLSHATPYYLAAHILQAEKDEIPIPLLIHRIRSNDPAPELNQKYHLHGCGCFECLYLIYTPDKGYLDPEDFDPAAFLKSRL